MQSQRVVVAVFWFPACRGLVVALANLCVLGFGTEHKGGSGQIKKMADLAVYFSPPSYIVQLIL